MGADFRLPVDFCMPRELILYDDREVHIVNDATNASPLGKCACACICAVLLDLSSSLQEVPICDLCLNNGDAAGIIKPDIVFFGEGLAEEFHHQIHTDKEKVCAWLCECVYV